MTVPWTQNQVIISGLQSGAEYDVTVRTSTAAGMSGTIQILCNSYSIQSLHFHCAVPVGPGGRTTITTPSSQTAADPASSSSDNTVAIIGGVVSVVIVVTIVIAITILIAIALILRSRRAEFSPNQK